MTGLLANSFEFSGVAGIFLHIGYVRLISLGGGAFSFGAHRPATSGKVSLD